MTTTKLQKGDAAFWVQVSCASNGGEVLFRFVPVTVESYGKRQATVKLMENGKMSQKRFYTDDPAPIGGQPHPVNRFPRLIPADQELANKLAAEHFEAIGQNHLDGLIRCDESWMEYTAAGSEAKYGRKYVDEVTTRLAKLKNEKPTLRVLLGVWTPENK